MQDKIITYVYEGQEVYLTGRIATPNPNAQKSKAVPMVEVLPKGTDSDDTTYARWVVMDDLLIIRDLEGEDFTDDEA